MSVYNAGDKGPVTQYIYRWYKVDDIFFLGGGGWQSRVHLTDDQFNIFWGEANDALF